MSEKRIDGIVLNQISEMLFGEFLNHEGNLSVDEVGVAIAKYSALSQISGHTAGFINVMTHVGNNARLGLKYDSSEPLFGKARRLVQRDRLSYAEESKLELSVSLPLVLEAIVNHPELEHPRDILEKLQNEGTIKNEAFSYNPSLMRELKNLASIIAV